MDDDAIEGLAALEAAGALSQEESARLRAALAGASAQVRARAAGLCDAAAAAAIAAAPAVPPSAGLRQRVLSSVSATIETDRAGRFSFLIGDDGPWQSMGVPGAFMRVLTHDAARYSVVLVKGEPGVRFPPHHHGGAEECYIVSGDLFSQGRRFFAGDFVHAEAGSDHDETSSEGGCLLVIIAAASGSRETSPDVHV